MRQKLGDVLAKKVIILEGNMRLERKISVLHQGIDDRGGSSRKETADL